MDYMHLYGALPVFLQEVALSAYGLVLQRRYYGPGFAAWRSRFEQQERWPRPLAEQWQVGRLQRILQVAASHTPYYRAAFRTAGITPAHVQSLKDLERLPLLEKETVRQDAKQLVDERCDVRRLTSYRTSGSTGTPLVIYWSRDATVQWWALQETRVRAWAGVAQSMPRAMVGGRPIVPGNCKEHYWRYNCTWRQLYLSSYHISPDTAAGYVAAIRRYGCQWITGYGSAIALLGEWLVEHPQPDLTIRSIVTSGDGLLPGHRQAIERGFRSRVFDNYGNTEGCLVICECEQGRLHVQPESGILEILDQAGQPCPPGQVGEMVITGLVNQAMPLIRYRIGDLAAWSTEAACPCGRQSPLVSHIEGRADEYLLLPDGRRIGRLSTAIKKALTVRSAQIVQDAPDHAWLLILPDHNFCDADGQIIKEDILSRIGAFPLDVRLVACLPKTSVGKQKLVVRLMDHPDLARLYSQQLPEVRWRC